MHYPGSEPAAGVTVNDFGDTCERKPSRIPGEGVGALHKGYISRRLCGGRWITVFAAGRIAIGGIGNGCAIEPASAR
jgi:hypothetical protein